MSGYIEVPFTVDVDAMLDEALAFLAARYPGWTPGEAHLEVALVEELCRLVHEGMVVATQVPRAIFRFYGQSLLALPPVDASPATALSTWTMVDAAGYIIPAGTAVGYRVSGDTLVPFVTDAEYAVVPGQNVRAGVGLIALEDGAQHNGYPAGAFEPIEQLAFVDSVVTTTVTGGGADAESDTEYLDRLADELTLWTPRPILAPDFAKLARRVAGVHRALGIDNYDPVANTYGNERMVTVALVDETGDPVGAPVAAEVAAYLEGFREVNFIVNTMDPDYAAIDVLFSFTTVDGYVPADVKARAEGAVLAYLDPGTWAGGGESPPRWDDEPTVRYLELAALLNNVAGLRYLTVLTINGGGVNVALPAPAGLPGPVTAVGTAV